MLSSASANLYLVGMPGSGKSRVGRAVAGDLEMEYVDLDEAVAARAGVSIEEMLAPGQEERFRALEAEALEECAAAEGRVVSTGGGAALREPNRQAMARSGVTFWIVAPVSTLAERLRNSARLRPLLGRDFTNADLDALLQERAPCYEAAADFKVMSGDDCYQSVVAIFRRQTGRDG